MSLTVYRISKTLEIILSPAHQGTNLGFYHFSTVMFTG